MLTKDSVAARKLDHQRVQQHITHWLPADYKIVGVTHSKLNRENSYPLKTHDLWARTLATNTKHSLNKSEQTDVASDISVAFYELLE
jgi:hypothetical protein